ncbi:sensor histidine kinase [Saccharothrix violaceirubra]|uniref:Sensor-like histidine kinase SenX3 n=1 Tax=Saccharothrix violaceirubra TaxID=413306 RepID=A0A7W7T8A5_9PSEU|nr:PAS domain-containing sensor histidine kinase [Saccharothrix violaceirubra]MBB4968393.1 signal transduction histidine kinase [Saccharothrix violaceirubra]
MADRAEDQEAARRASVVADAVRSVVGAGAEHAVQAAVSALAVLPGVVRVFHTTAPHRSGSWAPAAGGHLVVETDPAVPSDVDVVLPVVASAVDALVEDDRFVPTHGFYEELVRWMPAFVVLLDETGVVRWTNIDRWPDGSQVRVDGGDMFEAIATLAHPDDQRSLTDTLAMLRTAPPGTSRNGFVRVRTPEDGWQVLNVVVQNHLGANPVDGLLGFGLDVTETHQAQFHRRLTVARLGALVGALDVGVMLHDSEYRVLVANDALVSLLDLTVPAADLVGFDLSQYLSVAAHPEPYYAELIDLARHFALQDEPVRGEVVALGGGLRMVEVDFVPVDFDARRHGQVWVLRDVTEQERARRDLECRNAELSRLYALKTEFIATVSHELRTPLTTLVGLAPLLGEVLQDPDLPLADAVERNVRRLVNLVETLLFLAKVESGSLPLRRERVDPDGLLRRQLSETRLAAKTRRVVFRLSGGRTGADVQGDADLLGRMLKYVLTSVAGTCERGTTVEVRSTVRDGRWVADVVDPSNVTSTSGRMFVALPQDGTDPFMGSGLGLALARAISERHGGSVWVTTEAGADDQVGTVLRVELPLSG